MVRPMSSFTGYITYLKFVSGSTKSPVQQGDLFNSVFALGDAKKNVNFTSSVVDVTDNIADATAQKTIALNWTPVLAGTTILEVYSSQTLTGAADAATTTFTASNLAFATAVSVDGTPVTTGVTFSGNTVTFATAPGDADNPQDVVITGTVYATDVTSYTDPTDLNKRDIVIVTGATGYAKTTNPETGVTQVVFTSATGTIVTPPASTGTSGNAIGTLTQGLVRANPTADYQPPVGYGYDNTVKGVITIAANKLSAGAVKVQYTYNNEYVPQNDLPLINMQVEAITLTAKVRRIAVYYSQIAAFQSQTDYDTNMQEQLASKAVGELSYEIDTEIVDFLYQMGKKNNAEDAVIKPFSRVLPVGINYKLVA